VNDVKNLALRFRIEFSDFIKEQSSLSKIKKLEIE